MTILEIYVYVLAFIFLVNIFVVPFAFGKDRGEYNAGDWLFSVIVIHIPILYILYSFLIIIKQQ